jgi:hypothetical protein
MDTAKAIIQRMLPSGTTGAGDWSDLPYWPPDLFAVAATIVNLSGCYAHTRYLCGFADCTYDEAYRERIQAISAEYADGIIPTELEHSWEILRSSDILLDASDPVKNQGWWDAAMILMAAADQASTGVGFAYTGTRVAYLVWEGYLAAKSPKTPDVLPYLPHSLCTEVPPQQACVQPKTRTPQIGCTIRSLSHNLALLPPIGEVKTHWDYAISGNDNSDEPLNVLVVPFPYRITGTCFVPRESTEKPKSPRATLFDINQRWIAGLKAKDVAHFIEQLIVSARKEVDAVHAVVLPEAALTEKMAVKVAQLLADEAKIELFVSGVVAGSDGATPQNCTYSAVYKGGQVVASWLQAKHHRWKLDESQIRRYHLGHVLGKRRMWWEAVDVSERECHFFVFRDGASLAVLICEDLARVDPVQNVLRAVGPNLVIAVLMDGPQLERRWPGRYATVLADDPGSAVLTLTSLGLIRRSNMPSEKGNRYIALWKEPLGIAQELELPDGAHALLLTISPGKEENVTADGRSDYEMTTKLSLTSVIAVRHAGVAPAWLDAV